MKYKDVFEIDDGIFNIIDYEYSGEGYTVSSESLDTLFYMLFCNRPLIAVFGEYYDEITHELSEVFKQTLKDWFIQQFTQKWESLINDLLLDYNPLEPVNYTLERTRNEEREGEGASNSKVYGYNSSDGVDKDQTHSENVSSTDISTSETRTGRLGNSKVLDNISEHIKLHSIDVMKIMCYDIAEFILLPLYEMEDVI